MRLILIRHSQTNYNLKNRYCGFTDVDINNIGKIQAKKIRHKLAGLKVDKIFCSDLKRSWQTANVIFNHRGCLIIKTANLREIDFGIWEGLNFKQVLKRYPSVYKKWLKDPFRVDIPNGERMCHFKIRVTKELKNIIKHNPNKTVAIVCHLGPMRVILNTILKIKDEDFWKIRLKPEAIYIIDLQKVSKLSLL